MVKSVDCPSCGAPLEYNSGLEPMTKCYFCGSLIAVPQEWRSHKTDPAPRPTREPRHNPASRFVVVLVMIVIAGCFAAFFAFMRSQPAPEIAQQPLTGVNRPASSSPAKANGFATLAMTFGSEGIGPGMFNDARSIAVDAEGRIYVGEYSGGRIQVFDQAGKFITQWMADKKMPLRGLASDRGGTVYVAQRGVISRYEGPTGKAMGQLQYGEGWGFDDVAVAADGGIVAAWYKNRDDIVRFDSEWKNRPRDPLRDKRADRKIRASNSRRHRWDGEHIRAWDL